MSSIKLQGNAGGAGTQTLQAAATSGTPVVTLPDTTGTLIVTGGDFGTPSAIVLTNGTGLPLTTGVTGVLPVANGGTGVTASSGANSVVLRDANGNITTNATFNGFTSVAASGTPIILTAASTPVYNVTGSGGQVIQLPNATTLPSGTVFWFDNNQSSGAITVNNASSSLVVSVPSGGYVTVVLLSNATSAGSWDRHDLTPSNTSWSTNTLDYPGSITNATWNGVAVAANRGGTGVANNSASTITISGAFGTTITVSGTTAVTLPTSGTLATLAGTETFTNKTLTNPTITNYTETNFTATVTGNAITLSLTNGTFQTITTMVGANAITLPSPSAGKSLTVQVVYASTPTSLTFTSPSGTLKYPGGTTPTATLTNTKVDIYAFISDGTNWYGIQSGANF